MTRAIQLLPVDLIIKLPNPQNKNLGILFAKIVKIKWTLTIKNVNYVAALVGTL